MPPLSGGFGGRAARCCHVVYCVLLSGLDTHLHGAMLDAGSPLRFWYHSRTEFMCRFK